MPRRASASARSTTRTGLCAGCLRTLDEIAGLDRVLDATSSAPCGRRFGRPPRRGRAVRAARNDPWRTVDWYFDFVSPFAYLQSERLATLAPKLRVRYRPVLFAALLAAHGQKGPAEIARKRVFTYRYAVWLARRQGVALKMPHEHPFNPLPLLRLAIACDCAPDAVHRIFRFVWRDGRLPDLPIEWDELARDLRLPDAQRRIGEADVKDALRRNTDEAIARGVFGVPTLMVGDELFWGVDATRDGARLHRAGARARPTRSTSASPHFPKVRRGARPARNPRGSPARGWSGPPANCAVRRRATRSRAR